MLDALQKMEMNVAEYLRRLGDRGIDSGLVVARARTVQRELLGIRLRLTKREITELEATLLTHELMLLWARALNEGSPLG